MTKLPEINFRYCQVALVVKNLTVNAGDIRNAGSIPGLGRSAGGGHGNPLQNPIENHKESDMTEVT